MNKNIILSIVMFSVSFFAESSAQTYSDSAKCIDVSAEKFGVPPDVLRAIIISDTKYKIGMNGVLEAKPFDFHIANKKILSDKGGFDWDKVTKNTCESYNAVAWYLMNVSGGNKRKDIWDAVGVFFYGENYKNKFAFKKEGGYNPYRASLNVYNKLKSTDKTYHEKYGLWRTSKETDK